MALFPRLCAKIVKWLDRKGFVLIRKQRYLQDIRFDRDVEEACLIQPQQECIDSIVFSKDRAMQLHAFLSSYLQQAKGCHTMYILYKASDDRHRKSYRELEALFVKAPFVFVEETDFRRQMIELVSNSAAKSIALYVDDMVFLRSVDYNALIKLPTRKYVVALSRGKDLVESVVLQRKVELPEFEKLSDGLLSFRWDCFNYLSDWTYPLGVSGYIFGKSELSVLFSQIEFKAPNSLEIAMQRYKSFFQSRQGVCYPTIACCCVHANLVQTGCVNPTLETFSVQQLLERWEQGECIDLTPFYEATGGVAQVMRYRFTKRENPNG
ncbi:MAG: hypothetical protein PHV66_06095 [Bacteroidales bacterium]|nr:hypothetical protein [Bacteroidales bacterium]